MMNKFRSSKATQGSNTEVTRHENDEVILRWISYSFLQVCSSILDYIFYLEWVELWQPPFGPRTSWGAHASFKDYT